MSRKIHILQQRLDVLQQSPDAVPERSPAAATYAGPIHLLATDVMMPHMSGRELADRLAHVRPSTKVLYISGYSAEVLGRYGGL